MWAEAESPNVDNTRSRTVPPELRCPQLAASSFAKARGKGWQTTYSRWLMITDVMAVLLSVGFAQLARFGPTAADASISLLHITYFEVSIFIAVLWIAALSINHSKSPRIVGSGVEEYRRVWWATITVFGGVSIISMLFKLELARGYLMLALPIGLFLLFLSRWIARKAVARARRDFGKCITRLLVVGSPNAVRDLTSALAREQWSGYDVVGACVPGRFSRPNISIPGLGTIPVLGDETTVARALTVTGSRAVAVAASEQFHGKGIRELSWQLDREEVDLLVAPGVVDVAGPRLHMRPVAGLPLIHVEKPQYHGAKKFQKRSFDVGFASLALLCALPLLAVIALAIKLSDRGPVFYRQQRVGLDGVPFEMIKFRTMIVGADKMLDQLVECNEADGGVLFKIRKDPRVTPVGRLLRKYSLDEIPQFLNVLKGQMSVVGPRPPLAAEVASYDNHAKRRLLVRPGITGLWQVSGRSDLSWEDSVRLDLFYVENWSMMADLLIALKTMRVVLKHTGAY